jgi:hypothetical protein
VAHPDDHGSSERTDGRTRVERDRDGAGRARNSRPRDALGRPLPYGAAGVARLPEGVVRSAEQTVALAQSLLDDGRPFQAHEVFEDAWKSGEQASRPLWKGLAQLAVGITHAARGNPAGAASLLRRAVATVAPVRSAPPHGIAVAELCDWALDSAARLDGQPPGRPIRLDAPQLRTAPSAADAPAEDAGGSSDVAG